MKKLLLTFLGGIILSVQSQTPLFQNTAENIWSGNSAACTTTGPGTIHNNSFIRVFDTDNFNIQDTAFFVYIEFAVQETSGGVYNLIGRVHKLDGTLSFANMTLISDDTAAVYPDSSIYKMKIPFDQGYGLPGDTLVTEVFAPLNGSIIFFPGSNPYLETGPSYIAASGCGLAEPTPFADLGFTDVKLILKLWVNQKPMLNPVSASVFKDNVLTFEKTAFDLGMLDYDSDTINMLRIQTLPANGTLELNATALAIGDTILSNEINLLTYTPNAGYFGTDQFTLMVKDGYHWSNIAGDVLIDVVNWQVGLNEAVVQHGNVFPNPATDVINVSYAQPIIAYQVIDQLGNEVSIKMDHTNQLDLSELPAGVYYFVGQTAVGISCHKFVKL